MDYSKIITIGPGKMGGKPCIRGMRMTVYDVLDYLASGIRQPPLAIRLATPVRLAVRGAFAAS